MTQPLTNEEVKQRFHDYLRDNYAFLGNVTKGVSLAIATTVLLQILGDFHAEWMRLAPWLASFAGIIVTYMTWHTGVVLTNSRANALDNILPLVMGMAEFLLFAVLLRDESHPIFWLNWFGFLGIHAFVGTTISHNRLKLTDFSLDFADAGLSKIYQSWLKVNQRGAAVVSIAAFSSWGILRGIVYSRWGIGACSWAQFVLAIVFMVVLGRVIYDADQMRRQSDNYVSQPNGAATAKGQSS